MKVKVHTDSYNKMDSKEQWIRITSGCPNQCAFCYEPSQIIEYNIPKIERNLVKIMDMNLLIRYNILGDLYVLSLQKVNDKVVYYEAICGIDWRRLTPEIAFGLKQARFKNIRLAWDYQFSLQKKIVNAIKLLLKAGYRPHDITVFMICNWKTPYSDNLRKLDICKVWNVKAADCYFDNQLSPNIKPIHWTIEQIKDFRRKCRKHNQLVNFKIDPEVK